MFWRYFFWNGLEPIVLLEDSVTSKLHAKTIQKYVIPILQKHFSCDNKIFQKDNAISNYSKVVKNTHENAEIVMLP